MKSVFALAMMSVATLAFSAHADDKIPDPATLAASNSATPASGDYVMLKVNGEEIKKSEVDEAWKSIFEGRETPSLDSMGDKVKAKFLRELASEHVLLQQAEKEGIENTPVTKEALAKVKRQILIQQLLRSKTKDAVTDEKLKADYDAHVKAAASEGQEYHARHILVKTKDEADAVEKKLKNGGDFDKIAKEKSQDKASGATGGDLGWFPSDKMVPEFTAALLKLKKGEISPPVKTDFGWHVIQLEDTRKITAPPFAEVKESLKQEVGNKAVRAYVTGVMAEVKVTQLDAQGHETPVPEITPESKSAPAGKNAPAAKGDNADTGDSQ